MTKEKISQDLKTVNEKVAEACHAHINVFDRMMELEVLSKEGGGYVALDDLPEHFYLEVQAYGAEQALENYRCSLKATRDYVKDCICEYYELEEKLMKEFDDG